jgi:FlaA1/EpsC-like NDP-sugar epimerase
MIRTGNSHILLADLLVIVTAPLVALAVRVENPGEFVRYLQAALVLSCLRLIWYLLVFCFAGLYNRYWRYAAVDEIMTLASIHHGIVAEMQYLLRKIVPQIQPRSQADCSSLKDLASCSRVRATWAQK